MGKLEEDKGSEVKLRKGKGRKGKLGKLWKLREAKGKKGKLGKLWKLREYKGSLGNVRDVKKHLIPNLGTL